jgi:glyoxylase-like metal-dependent hydrolase (beta-lactamase superfamily II)
VSYTGDVVRGGPAAVRELDEVVVRKAAVGPMNNNAYLLSCRASGAQLLIDAAAEPDRLLDLVRDGSRAARLDLIVTTHRHPDHHGALASIVTVTGAPTAAGDLDAQAIEEPTTRLLRHGDVLTVGHLTLEVIALRGHTPGSVALAYREPEHASSTHPGADGAVPGRVHLFTGDSLFPGGPGKTPDPAAFTSLMDDLEARIFADFDDQTWVYPGHGNDTTLGTERAHLPEWRTRGW